MNCMLTKKRPQKPSLCSLSSIGSSEPKSPDNASPESLVELREQHRHQSPLPMGEAGAGLQNLPEAAASLSIQLILAVIIRGN